MANPEKKLSIEELEGLWNSGPSENQAVEIYRSQALRLSRPDALNTELKWDRATGKETYDSILCMNVPVVETIQEKPQFKQRVISYALAGIEVTLSRAGTSITENNPWLQPDAQEK